MEEVEIKFERENVEGVIPVGTYLFDAARRLGIEIDCERLGESDLCAMRIKNGGGLLSETTKAEIKHLTSKRRKNGERLACQAKIERAGEIEIMTTKKKEKEKPSEEARTEEYRKQFEELPLEKKIASLVELEAIALGETFSFVLNSPYKIFDKVLDVLAEFGLKIETSAKEATRPSEHKSKGVKAEAESHTEKTETEKS